MRGRFPLSAMIAVATSTIMVGSAFAVTLTATRTLPSNVRFDLSISGTDVNDARAYNTDGSDSRGDAYDGFGVFDLDGTRVAFESNGDDCTLNNETTGTVFGQNVYTANPTILTCSRPITVNGDVFQTTVVRTFSGSWVEWQLSLSRISGTYYTSSIPVIFTGDYGSDSSTTYVGSAPSGATTKWVSYDGESASDPVIFQSVTAVNASSLSVSASNTDDVVVMAFNAGFSGSVTFTVRHAIIWWSYSQIGATQADALACAAGLTASNFGSTILLPTCPASASFKNFGKSDKTTDPKRDRKIFSPTPKK